MQFKLFKIIDTNTGLFSDGGVHPTFSKKGKTWKTIGALKSHLVMVRDGLKYNKKNIKTPLNWTVVELRYELAEEITHLAANLIDQK